MIDLDLGRLNSTACTVDRNQFHTTQTQRETEVLILYPAGWQASQVYRPVLFACCCRHQPFGQPADFLQGSFVASFLAEFVDVISEQRSQKFDCNLARIHRAETSEIRAMRSETQPFRTRMLS